MQTPLSRARGGWSLNLDHSAQPRGDQLVTAADYPFLDIVGTMLVFFAWVIWIWLLITVFADIFRRHDIGGWGKAGWIFVVIILPYLGVLIYMIAQGKHMAERSAKEVEASRAAFDSYVKNVAAESGPTGQIAQAKQLLDSGAISQAEFDQIKQKALAG
jgi:putative oligomerization/nucleic acid binding protein/phospholipase D-like protein